jgi:hypothetical protein
MRSLLSRSRSWWFVPMLVLTHALATAGGCGRSELEPLGSGNVGSGGRGGAGASGMGGRGASTTQLPPTPGLLLCGSTICIASAQQCCLGLGAGGLDAQCVAPGTACPGATVQCDEPADCPSPKVCCAGLLSASSSGSGGAGAGAGSLIPGLSIGSRCEARTACSGAGELIVCRASTDCGTGSVCCPGIGVATCQTSCTSL